MILPRVKRRRSRRMAWALLVVIGKYQVVEDLKGSNESEKVPRFFCVRNRTHSIPAQFNILLMKTDGAGWDITRRKKRMKKGIFITMFCTCFFFISAQVTINSEPSGAKVFQEGKYIGTTPCNASLNVKSNKLVYDIDANKVRDPSKPPYSYEFTITMDGYEPATVYFEGQYEYHQSGWVGGGQKYYIVKPKSYKLFAVLKKDNAYASQKISTNDEQQKDKEANPNIRWHFDSDPEDAKIFWKVKSSIPDIVKNTELLYLGETPFNETKPLNIKGLNENNSDKVEIEIVIIKKGYIKQTKSFSGNSLINQQEISWFFDLIEEKQ
jgi:hypothetical protein